jgi:hypothetical protein
VIVTREKSSQSERIYSGALRDERGPRENSLFVGLGEKNRKVCLISRRRPK